MKLIFPNKPEDPKNCTILKETKRYITFRCKTNLMKYRYNKETGEVQDGTYHNTIKGLKVEL